MSALFTIEKMSIWRVFADPVTYKLCPSPITVKIKPNQPKAIRTMYILKRVILEPFNIECKWLQSGAFWYEKHKGNIQEIFAGLMYLDDKVIRFVHYGPSFRLLSSHTSRSQCRQRGQITILFCRSDP